MYLSQFEGKTFEGLKSDYFRIEIYINPVACSGENKLKSDYFRIEMWT